MSTSTLYRCDNCGTTAPGETFSKPDTWFSVLTPRGTPSAHFCSVGCLSLHYRAAVPSLSKATLR